MSSYPKSKKVELNNDMIDDLTLKLIVQKGRECMKYFPHLDLNKIKNPILQKIKVKLPNNNINDGSKTS